MFPAGGTKRWKGEFASSAGATVVVRPKNSNSIYEVPPAYVQQTAQLNEAAATKRDAVLAKRQQDAEAWRHQREQRAKNSLGLRSGLPRPQGKKTLYSRPLPQRGEAALRSSWLDPEACNIKRHKTRGSLMATLRRTNAAHKVGRGRG